MNEILIFMDINMRQTIMYIMYYLSMVYLCFVDSQQSEGNIYAV